MKSDFMNFMDYEIKLWIAHVSISSISFIKVDFHITFMKLPCILYLLVNPLILYLRKANVDIQFVAESSLALAGYVTAYVTKAEKSNLQDVWTDIASSGNVYSKLWSLIVR